MFYLQIIGLRKYFCKLSILKILWIILTSIAIAVLYYCKIQFSNNEVKQRYMLKSCLNQVIRSNNISIWTHFNKIDYVNSVVKLFNSVDRHYSKDIDILILEVEDNLLPEKIRTVFTSFGWKICRTNNLKIHNNRNDDFLKLMLWKFTEYESNYYFDPDTLIIRDISNLMHMHKNLNETIRIGVTNEFNDGGWKNVLDTSVFLIKPDNLEFKRLVNTLNNDYSFKNIDTFKDFINKIYLKNQTYDIGFVNNANMALYSQYPDFWTKNQDQINVINYNLQKPWNCSFEFAAICEYWLDSYCNVL